MRTREQGETVILPWDDDFTGAAIYSLVDPNGKRYIGQATRLQERLAGHQKACASILDGSTTSPLEGQKMVRAIKGGVTFKVEILKKLENDEATINNLRYWENEYVKKFGGLEDTYNVSKPPAPIWTHDPFNEIIVNESPNEARKRIKSANIDAYQKENIQRVVVKFNRKNERDQRILNYLYAQKKASDGCSVQEYIKRAIAERMNR